MTIRRQINGGTRLQHTADLTVNQSLWLHSPVFFAFLSQSATGPDLARPVGLRNVLCTWVSSASLSQVFVRTSCRQPAIYLRTTITMCSAELFLDVMLLCFVLQQLKIHPYLAGHGLQIQTVLFLIRACKWCYSCVLILWHKVAGRWSESFIDTWRHKLIQTAAGGSSRIVGQPRK